MKATSPVVPSFVAKVGWAKKHLCDLQAAVADYAATKPYMVTERGERQDKKPIRRLRFTDDPADTDIPLIAADAIYNLRASLDHLMSALVPNKDRSSVMFPIYWEGVWEPAIPGENKQRSKDRSRWASDTKTLPAGALAVLKWLQPPEHTGDHVPMLKVINALSNTDRHTKLPVFAAGLDRMAFRWVMPDGTVEVGGAASADYAFAPNNAALFGIPYHAVKVEIEGTPRIMARVAYDGRDATDEYTPIPGDLWFTAGLIADEIIPKLIPFIRS